ncbi:unnamed protein product [Arabidopsis halleri]
MDKGNDGVEKPQSTNTRSKKPPSTDTRSNMPQSTDSKSKDPQSTDSKTKKPPFTDSKANKPPSTDAKSKKPPPTDSKSNKPQSTDSKSKKPQSTVPTLKKSQATDPKMKKSQSTISESAPQYEEFNRDLLPRRIYATDRYPVKGRINSYSKPEYLLDLVEALEGTEDLAYIRGSCFGPLFDLPVRKASLSGKLVHQMLCRAVHTWKRYEIWFVFGGQPFRFSLREFGLLTGLPCGKSPKAKRIIKAQTSADPSKPYWKTLISETENVVSIKEIVGWLKRDKRLPEKERMPSWRRRRLALVVIVEGILLCNNNPVRASTEVVEMVRDLEQFEKYPWGRESFQLTLRMVKVSSKVKSLQKLRSKLDQSHTATHGFTLAFQLMILKAIPAFERFLPNPDDERTFTDPSVIELTPCKTFHNSNIMDTEKNGNIQIDPIMVSDDSSYNAVNKLWTDEVDDPSVVYLRRG